MEPRRTHTVLLVDDDELVLAVLRDSLELGGYKVLSADTPAAALRLAEDHPGRIALLLTDLVMPQMDGAELARQVRGARPDLPVVYISGYPPETLAEIGVRLDPWPILRKPGTLEELLAVVQNGIMNVQPPVE